MAHRRFLLIRIVPGAILLLVAFVVQAEPVPIADLRAQVEADWAIQDTLRGPQAPRPGGVTTREDALGAVDGVKNGKWGFHTQNEAKAWWQVDLGTSQPLSHVLVFNRCEAGMAERNNTLMVLLSDDAKTWKEAYNHNGKPTFYGFTDSKPLRVDLKGAAARFVRLQLPTTNYFDLDEVEVYAAADPGKNIALWRDCDQSSVSQWSERHARGAARVTYRTQDVIDRGRKLAADLRARGAAVEAGVQALQGVSDRLRQLPATADEEAQKKLYLEARWTVRKLALRNPLLDFEAILFVKSAPGVFPHISDQFYGWWSRPGGGVYVLEGFKGDSPRVRCLSESFAPGSFLRPDVSYDGKKVLFAYCKHYPQVADIRDKASKVHVPEDAFYHIFEMNIDPGAPGGLRQLTHGRYDDFDARYLSDGNIVFLSTRKGTFLQCTKAGTGRTAQADLPDSYVRCGGDNYRPVPVFTLHRMDADGGNLCPISAFENFEWTPSVNNEGQLLYTRWDYIDRFNGHFFSLWSANPDGTNPQLVYGNYTVRPQAVSEARAVPNSPKVIFTAAAHHSITGGSLCLLDRARGLEGFDPIIRLTPEVPFPETEAWADMYYANPFPLSEEHYLVGWADRRLPPHCRVDSSDRNPVNAMAIYLYDAYGNLNLLCRDRAISSSNPIPVKARPKPPVYFSAVAWDGPQEGTLLLQDVYQGLAGVPRGSVKSVRIVGVPPKVQPHMNNPNLGVSSEDPGKFVLGTVPVEADGSAYFRVPSGISIFFQAIDADGLAIQTMRSLTYVQPGQTLSCIGCHESRDSAPPRTAHRLAAGRTPSKLTPGPEGTWPLRFDRLVQPVLDKHCVSCHKSGATNPKAAAFDLTPGKAYSNLLAYGGRDLHGLAFEKDMSIVGNCPARKSKLWALLTSEKGHEGVKLDADSRARLATWMDTYAQRQGHFSDEQEKRLQELRAALAGLLQDQAKAN